MALFLAVVACTSADDLQPTVTLPGSPAIEPTQTVPQPAASPAPTPTATPRPVVAEPKGFPIDPGTRLGIVYGSVGSRTIAWGAGPMAMNYSLNDQASNDPVVANRAGWNCRVHQEYEARPAVDWYIPEGMPVLATLDGVATLYVISVPNAFDYYDADREPYTGNPDRARAQPSPFPGPGGGKGVYIEVTSEGFVTEYAHLEIGQTIRSAPEGSFLAGYSRGFDYAGAFGTMRAFNDATAVARWEVRAGDVIGYSGDSGYSEAPHLHYTVRRAGTTTLLCPTSEPGFADGGWLSR